MATEIKRALFSWNRNKHRIVKKEVNTGFFTKKTEIVDIRVDISFDEFSHETMKTINEFKNKGCKIISMCEYTECYERIGDDGTTNIVVFYEEEIEEPRTRD